MSWAKRAASVMAECSAAKRALVAVLSAFAGPGLVRDRVGPEGFWRAFDLGLGFALDLDEWLSWGWKG